MEIKVLGTGCPKCKRLEEFARQAAQEAQVEFRLEKVSDINDIMAYPITGTPALVINGEVVSSGRVPGVAEIVDWLRSAEGSTG